MSKTRFYFKMMKPDFKMIKPDFDNERTSPILTLTSFNRVDCRLFRDALK